MKVQPADGAVGVSADAEIIVTFSEPMDRTPTEIAYDSTDLGPQNVTFSWSSDDRELTVHPDKGLRYGPQMGNSIQSYAYTIRSGARDKAQNQLTEDASFSFTMLSILTTSVAPAAVHLVHHSQSGEDTVTVACEGDGEMIGEEGVGSSAGLLIAFSVQSLADILPERWYSAQLAFETRLPTTALGPIVVARVNEEPSEADWNTPVLETLPLTMPTGPSHADALDGLVEDLSIRTDGITQYFVHHAELSNGQINNQSTYIACDSLRLTISYLVE